MQLDCYDLRAYRDERGRQSACPSTDIENQIASGDAGVLYDASGPATIELMPPPPGTAFRGHGGP